MSDFLPTWRPIDSHVIEPRHLFEFFAKPVHIPHFVETRLSIAVGAFKNATSWSIRAWHNRREGHICIGELKTHRRGVSAAMVNFNGAGRMKDRRVSVDVEAEFVDGFLDSV